jgi:hypothetical protein
MLIDAVPQSHKDFLHNLDWVIDLQTPFSLKDANQEGRLICVHAGLNNISLDNVED